MFDVGFTNNSYCSLFIQYGIISSEAGPYWPRFARIPAISRLRESDVGKIAYKLMLYVSQLTKYLIALNLTIAGLLPIFSEQPNIIFIMSDDMGYGDVQALNPLSTIPTPNLDRLAREGMTFTRPLTIRGLHAFPLWSAHRALLLAERFETRSIEWIRSPNNRAR